MKARLILVLAWMLAAIGTKANDLSIFSLSSDTIIVTDTIVSDTIQEEPEVIIEEEQEDEEEEESQIITKRKKTRNYLNFDLGMNNWLENGGFPDSNSPYSVKPWGSWYVALTSVYSTQVAGPVFLEWGGGVSWYNFKMEDPEIRISKGPEMIEFVQDNNNYNDYIKSKLAATYLNVHLVPMLKINSDNRKGFMNSNDKGFRIGAGMYAGYRVGSRSKFVFEDEKRQKIKDRGNFYLNNFRYGVRAQVGWKGTDLFFNYDLNPLFENGKGPDVNAFSFGVIF